jgi:pimeloyl-ACP methyl ester carboxylesterase
MAALHHSPPASFLDDVWHEELWLHGIRARALRFLGGCEDPGRAVVCVAGMGANGRSFVRQRPLAKDHFFLMLNLPRETPGDQDPLLFAVESVEEFMQVHGLSRPVLLGSSFGGAVAAVVALRERVRLGGLALANPVVARSQIPLAFPGFVNLLEAPDGVARFLAPLAVQIMGGFALDGDGRDEVVRESRLFTTRELKRRLHALMRLDLKDRLQALPPRTLWVHGRRDLLVPVKGARRAAARIGHARFEVIPTAGHLPYLSHPDAFNEILGSFLGEVGDA